MGARSPIVLGDIGNFFKKYFKRLEVVVSQVPSDLRSFLLPRYMLYKHFKAHVFIDQSRKLAFKVDREAASRLSPKVKSTNVNVEEEVFGVLGRVNMFRVSGIATLSKLVLTCKEFADRFPNELPKESTIIKFTQQGDVGPLEVDREAEVKVIDCSIYWMKKRKRSVVHIPFAWIFGNSDRIKDIDPIIRAESDFYFSLFSTLYYIATRGYELPIKEVRSKVIEYYTHLLNSVEEEFKTQLAATEADENVFQRLLERYMFFLHPSAIMIESQPTLCGRWRADFRLQISEDKSIYVEIEPPHCKPFEGSEPSRRLKAALKQISTWRNCAGKGASYLVLIGRQDDLSKEEVEALTAFNNVQGDLTVETWDYILKNISKLRKEIPEPYADS